MTLSPVSDWCPPDSPTAHSSDSPLVRQPISPTSHQSDSPLVRQPIINARGIPSLINNNILEGITTNHEGGSYIHVPYLAGRRPYMSTRSGFSFAGHTGHEFAEICPFTRYFSITVSNTNQINMTGITSEEGTAYPSGASEFTPGFQWGSCYAIFSFICMFCRSLFVLLYFFFWPLCCLFFFDIRILITSLWYLQALLMKPVDYFSIF